MGALEAVTSLMIWTWRTVALPPAHRWPVRRLTPSATHLTSGAFYLSCSAILVLRPALRATRQGGRMSDFPERLSTLRRAHGLTQRELADRISGSAAAVKKWEQGGTRPVPQTVAALAVALGVAPATLMGQDDEPPTTLADARLRRGLRAEDLAADLGVSGRHWRRVESGEVLPPDPGQLATLLKVTQPKLAELWWQARASRERHPDSQ